MPQRSLRFVELVTGRRDPSAVIARSLAGIVVPLLILIYSLRCIVVRQAMIIGKGHLDTATGLPAVAAGTAYALAAVALYVYVCWDDHPTFAGIRDAVLQLLLVGFALLYAAMIALALL